jgi:hypothetical protein
MLQHHFLEIRAPGLGDDDPGAHAQRIHYRLDQFGCHDQAFAAVAQVELHQCVIDLRMQRHRSVRRQCPGSRGPDRHCGRHIIEQRQLVRGREAEAFGEIGTVNHFEAHVDARRGLILVFHFGFGQRRAAVQAPMHRLEALV